MEAGSAGPELLDRSAELESLLALCERARAGSGGSIVVEAESGTGKSALLAAAAAEARRLGMEVLSGRGRHSECDVPFSAVMSFMYPRDWGPQLGPALFAGEAVPARDLFLADEPWPSAGFADPPAEMLTALTTLVARVSSVRPVVLLADDVQWFDPVSLAALAGAMSELGGRPVAILAATRPGGDPGSAPAGERLALRPLDPGAVAVLVRRQLGQQADEAFCDACAAEAAGDLHLLAELTGAARRAGLTGTAADAEALARLSAEIVTAWTTTALALASPPAVETARAVAVLGADATPSRAGVLAGLDVEGLAVAQHELVAAGILRAAAPLGFRHARAAPAVAAALSPSERARRHLAAARMLAPDDAVGAARHLLGAPLRGDPAVVAELRRAAAERIAAGAPGEAAAFLQRAAAEPPPPEELPEVTAELGYAEALLGAPEAARRLSRALELATDGRRRGEIAVDLANLSVARGEFHKGAAVLSATAMELAASEPAMAGELEAAMATVGHLGSALVSAARERLPAGDPALDGRADRLVALGAALDGALSGARREEVRALAARSWADGRLLDEQSADSWALSVLSIVLWWCDELDTGVEVATRALASAQRSGSVFGAAGAAACRALHHYSAGRLTAAKADLDAVEPAEAAGWRQILPTSRATAAQVAMEQGRLDDAARVIELPLVDWTGTLAAGPWLDARGRMHLASGRAEEALADAMDAERAFRHLTGRDDSALVTWRCTAALALLGLGRREEGAAYAQRELELAEASDSRRAKGIAQRTLGVLSPGKEGIAWLEASVATLGESEARLELARAYLELGAALRQAGRRADARAPLREAEEIALAGGVDGLLDRVRLELGAAGRSTGDEPRMLTASELRVARLAARGLTNREIANALRVTPQAVNWHLGNTYRKLGVRRSGLAAALGEGADHP